MKRYYFKKSIEKMYKKQINKNYDFKGENYSTYYPNLHKYPATMLPQIGIEIFKELKISKHRLLDPYCGTGSSILAGMVSGFSELHGFDINPLAVLIAKAKYTKLNAKKLFNYKKEVKKAFLCKRKNVQPPSVTNIHFWFSKKAIKNLSIIKNILLKKIDNKKYQPLFWLAFSETVRSVSYTRNNEFKLYRMSEEKRKLFNPDVLDLYFKYLDKILSIYIEAYLPLLKSQKFQLYSREFIHKKGKYDAVLTSPPYGDSRTTVAYGQFSTFANEWIGFPDPRKIDAQLMGGKKVKTLYNKGFLSPFIEKINKAAPKRALEVSSFYKDLEQSIKEVSKAVKRKGFSIYVVGNRTVKNITLPTDQFIAEQFEKNGFRHTLTYERSISSKVMPAKNSPTNVVGKKVNTMHKEYIIVCQKV